MEDGIQIRRIGVDDRAGHEALAELRWRWRVDERGEVGLGHDEFVAALGGWIVEHAASHLPYLATDDDGAIVGMAWLALVERVPGPEVWERRSAYVQSVYVPPEARRRGIARRLVDELIVESRRLGLDYLAVHPSDMSFGLYRAAGFAGSDRVLELRLP
jgi:ribosomal protein S18 acetylase RimI-like enzyme